MARRKENFPTTGRSTSHSIDRSLGRSPVGGSHRHECRHIGAGTVQNQRLTAHERVGRFAPSVLRKTRLTSRRTCVLRSASTSFAHAFTLGGIRPTYGSIS